MTQPLRWPNNAEANRMEAMSKAALIKHLLKPIIESPNDLTTVDLVRRAAQAGMLASEIELVLQKAKDGEMP